ncbi:hypothetical protein [Campylobacter upsaliensis]|uniref:Uncharacterized protein n=1 Tax=Campylobacter upsaliensis TaxID=28080 RepID=A0A381F3S7_CAMUP|nr:hypothetical protein [Campylobacter upsaliensis]SUX41036.1 Uncharacterised protein [Campylobacter upsaliensis]SUX41147.1 Uncharacterised protein [Campylobacter upsaliensis]
MQTLIYGSLKDEIQINTEIKQGNEKKVIDEAKAQIAELIGYEPSEYKGGNHIKLEDIETKEIFYCIEWHDPISIISIMVYSFAVHTSG